MRLTPMIALAAVGLLATGAAQAAPGKTPQERMAKALEGRTPGTPVDCIYQNQIQSSQIIDKTAIIYQVGRTLYVNTPRSGAEFLDSSDILVTDTHSPQLCSIDMVRLIDQGSRMPSGSLGLGKFVPYTKPKN
ncbi:MAG TPA: hypothetical protein VF503_27235 [Sphingobium sp.]|uniref:hypothetical protein n=1 Tax=Sphingobium sp. TaxID=1912891 RepID=UPI002ED6672C